MQNDPDEEHFSFSNVTNGEVFPSSGLVDEQDNLFSTGDAASDYNKEEYDYSSSQDDWENICQMIKYHITPRAAKNTNGE